MNSYMYSVSNFEVYHHFSGLSFIAEVNFWHPPKTFDSYDVFILIIFVIIIFFRRVYSECTKAIATSLILVQWLNVIYGHDCYRADKSTNFFCVFLRPY